MSDVKTMGPGYWVVFNAWRERFYAVRIHGGDSMPIGSVVLDPALNPVHELLLRKINLKSPETPNGERFEAITKAEYMQAENTIPAGVGVDYLFNGEPVIS